MQQFPPRRRIYNMQNKDQELIAQTLNGDHAAYAELVDRYKQALFRHCFAIMRDEDEAKDIAQDTFVKAYFQLLRYDNKFKFGTWLFKIATNLALDQLRRQKRQKVVSLNDITFEPVDKGASPHVLALYREMQTAIAELPPNYRGAISLYYWEGKSYKEVAYAMDVPEGTVKSWLSRAKSTLKEKLS
jgi:RNA polymerase sigma-70 factor (ECF subfamily)